ncbi:DUF6286 domain-containing protein [Herbiconiux sp. CPCC 205716]|uniref:DUF6286 domain-containing protein n=1 Tax=Herbiconiux gentiana TaxID=2970912 RepID=A0ABT2GLP5_9MICO|nr:DUF6286 domain-containing protein [Herbiconiux gentiana]MCS5715681.1 DUF6286 domain-containing protein [Herbiconiux gentiana]
MTTPALYRRLVRRETHSSRAGAAIAVAVVLMLLLAWVGTELVLSALGQPALLVAPTDAVNALAGAVAAPAGIVVAIGAVVAVIGLVLVVVALTPARRDRRRSGLDRTAAVVDDRVIATSLARTAAYAGDVDPEQVHVTVARRRASVVVTPSSGRRTDLAAIRSAVDAEVADYDFTPALRANVRLTENGTVGA